MRVTCPLVSHRYIMGKCCPDDSDFIFLWIFIRLADNEDRHKISDVRVWPSSDYWHELPASASLT